MIIVVEGPDGAGKTEFSHILAAEGDKIGLKASVMHQGPPPVGVNLQQHYYATVEEGRDSTRLVIADRLFMGEFVYGYHRRNDVRLTWHDLSVLDRAVILAPGCTFILAPSLRILEKRIADRGEPPHAGLDKERESFLFIGASMGYGTTVINKSMTYPQLRKIAKETIGRLK